MSTTAVVAVNEYLETSYRPDCEYIDGELLERNVGELDHSRMQMLLAQYLFSKEKQLSIFVVPEQRVQVKSKRFRVPDILVVTGARPSTPVLQEPPFLCIEILSSRDSMEQMQDRIDDYLAFGVPNVWIVNPRQRRAFSCTTEGMREAKDGILRTINPDIAVPIFELESA
jgi:Uma2 family endonuclease